MRASRVSAACGYAWYTRPTSASEAQPSRLMCACTGASAKLWRMPMMRPSVTPTARYSTAILMKRVAMFVSLSISGRRLEARGREKLRNGGDGRMELQVEHPAQAGRMDPGVRLVNAARKSELREDRRNHAHASE